MTQSYEKLDEIGRGRHSVLYEGYDHKFDRDVCIRELPKDQRENPGLLEAFLAEARSLAPLDHANLLHVLDMDEEEGWVVSELMRGSLADVVKAEGPLSVDRVRSVMQQVLRALDYLHKKDLIYGQVRPSKILYNDAGRVKLGYFHGIRGGVAPVPEHAKSAAPEMLSASFGPIGPPLDLYCLAFTALELLKGDSFDAEFPVLAGDKSATDPGWLRWHSSTQQTVKPAKEFVPGIPDDLTRAIDAALQKNVAKRPQTAKDMLALLDDRPILSVVDGGADSVLGEQIGGKRTASKSATATKSDSDQPPPKEDVKPKPVPAKPATAPPKDRSRRPVWIGLLTLLVGGIVVIAFLMRGDRPANDGKSTAGPSPAAESIQIVFELDPPDALLHFGGAEHRPDANGRVTVSVAQSDADKPMAYDAYKDGFATVATELKVDPAAKPEAVTRVVLPAVITVSPADATVKVGEDSITGDPSGAFAIPRDKEPFRFEASKSGYKPFQHDAMTLPMLREAKFTVTLSEDPTYYLQEGRTAAERKSFDEALKNFDRAVQIDPELAEGYFERGNVHAMLGRADGLDAAAATNELRQAIQELNICVVKASAPELFAAAYLSRGRVNKALGDLDAAIDDLTASLKFKSDAAAQKELAAIHFQRGSAAWTKGDWPRAIDDLNQARQRGHQDSELAGKLASAHYQLGLDLAKTGDRPKAIENLSAAIELDEKPVFLVGRGAVARDGGDAPIVMRDFNRAIELDSKYPAAYAERGWTHQRLLNDPQTAVADFDAALERGYEPAGELQLAAAECLVSMAGARLDTAKKEKDAVGISDAKMTFDFAISRLAKADSPDGSDVSAAKRACQLSAYRGRADVLYFLNQHAAAILDLTEALKAGNNADPELLIMRGYSFRATDDFDRAETDFRTVLTVNRNHVRASEGLLSLLVARGNRYRDDAKAQDTSNEEKTEARRRSLKDYQEAVEIAESLLVNDPESRSIHILARDACIGWAALAPQDAAVARKRDQHAARIKKLEADGSAEPDSKP